MLKQYLRVRIALVMLALGLASVNFFNWANDYWGEIPVDLPKAKSASVLEITTKQNPRFVIIRSSSYINGYGGGGSITSYETNDWQPLIVERSRHASARKVRKEVEERIKDATRVLEDSKDFDNKAIQRRIVLETEGNSKKWVEILRYDSERVIKVIGAQSLELALELEEVLEGETQ
jgi:hypothetical protein